MSTRDIHNSISVQQAMASNTIATDTTTGGLTIDVQGGIGVEFVISTSGYVDGTFVMVLESGDASDMSDAAVVPNDDILGTLTAVGADGVASYGVKKIGKRYLRLSVASTGTTSGATLSAVALTTDEMKKIF